MKVDRLSKRLVNYLIEMAIIFGSVYGAFLLEAKRTRNFERETLIGKLEMLSNEVYKDSLKFHDFYEDIDNAKWKANVNLWENVYYDSLAIQLLKGSKEEE